MRRFFLILCLAVAVPAVAQQSNEEPGFFDRLFGTDGADSDEEQGTLLERLIEDKLSGSARTVNIVGFQGALSGEASLESLTISDAQGVWLTLENATLDWNRSALFGGRLEVEELTAERILLPRLAVPDETADAPTPEATPFALPDLPVSIDIGRIAADDVQIGEPLFGAEVQVSIEGSMSLSGGEGAVDLAIERRDGVGAVTLDADYSNATEVLSLDLSVQEAEDGILATLLGLPGTPSVDFQISGSAPISDYAADVRLATDGDERLAGQITLSEAEDETRRIVADISGDIAPVFAPDYRPFFGDRISLRTEALIAPDGSIAVPNFALEARALFLNGSLQLGADRVPQRIAFTGQIASADGTPVLLPLGGEETRIDQAELKLRFDASQSEDWMGDIRIIGLSQGSLYAETLALSGTGRITPGDMPAANASLRFDAQAFDTGIEGLAEAIGTDLMGQTEIAWTSGGAVEISELELTGNALEAKGEAIIETVEAGPQVRGELVLELDRLANFSTLAGRPLSGQAELDTSFLLQPLSGSFDVEANGQTQNLTVGDPRADAILAGQTELVLRAARDEAGIRVRLDRLGSDAAELTASADLKSGGSIVSLEGRLNDTSVLLPALTGSSSLTFAAQEDADRNWTVQTELTGPNLSASVDGEFSDIYTVPAFAGQVTADVADLSVFSDLARRPLGGQFTLDATTRVISDLSVLSVKGQVSGEDLRIGQTAADRLLAGTLSANIDVEQDGSQITINAFEASTDVLDANVEGELSNIYEVPAFAGRIDASIADLSALSEAAGRPLGGRLAINAETEINTDLSRLLFNGKINGQDVRIGQTAADRLLAGTLTATIDVERDGSQATIRTFEASSDLLNASINGELTNIDELPAFAGRIETSIADLSALSEAAGRSLGGQLSINADTEVNADLSRVSFDGQIDGQDVRIGQVEADRLLAGALSARIDATKDGDHVVIEEIDISTPLLTARISGELTDGDDELSVNARLADLAVIAEGFPGALTVSGTVGRQNKTLELNLSASGPGGAQANLTGTAQQDFSTANLAATGTAPLGLANRFIRPRSLTGTANFDLRLNGALQASNLSGRVSTSGARLVAPTLGLALGNITGDINLANNSADIALQAQVDDGGSISINGPVGLAARNTAQLQVNFNRVRLSDPRLYETTASGQIRVNGPLAGGASITGALTLGETNIRIPDSGFGGAGEVPEITHLNEPPPVRGTRRRAGFLASQNESDGSTGGPDYALDVVINAPNRIFVRGRGLDSEFGGSLRLTGSTRNIVPIGSFDLIRGRLDILGTRLALDDARITIQGSFLPFLEIRASTDADEYLVNVNVTGPADDPEITFTSSPDLPQEEVLSRLIFGRGLETLSPIQAAQLALAVRTLAGQGGEGVVGRIRNETGLADLDVTTTEDGNAAVRAGAYLGRNVYTDVTVDSAGETELNLNLDITKSLTAKGGVKNTGETSIGIYFERDY